MTSEMKALIWARNQKGNVLNNTNVDCFIAGYEMASEENKEAIHQTFNKFFEYLPDKLEEEIKNLEARVLKTKKINQNISLRDAQYLLHFVTF